MQEDREADIVAVGGVQVPVMGEENEREITIEEVKRALNETKGGKAPGPGITNICLRKCTYAYF